MSNKSAVKCRVVETLGEFRRAIDPGQGGGDLLFRGQKNADWQVKSAFYRFCEKCGVRVQDQEQLYHLLLVSFFEECIRLGLFASNQRDDLDSRTTTNSAEALAQHYGLPTRFVDWSLSPYVAAFFAFGGDAFEQYPKKQLCSLFALNERRVLTGIKTSCRLSEHNAARALIGFSSASTPYTTRFAKYDNPENERIRSQVGALYAVPLGYSCFEEYLIKNDFPDSTLLKLAIPISLQPRILSELRSMRISGGDLYNRPDSVAIDIQHLLSRSEVANARLMRNAHKAPEKKKSL